MTFDTMLRHHETLTRLAKELDHKLIAPTQNGRTGPQMSAQLWALLDWLEAAEGRRV